MSKNINITREFLTSGTAIFTVSNPEGAHYTYRISAPDEQRDPANPTYFLSYMYGPDNTSDYTYMAMMNGGGAVFLTKASKVKAGEKIFEVAKWAIRVVWNGKAAPEGYKIQHIGKCGRCGRPLTTPESLETGIGPICSGKM
jgi:hypothetical protein